MTARRLAPVLASALACAVVLIAAHWQPAAGPRFHVAARLDRPRELSTQPADAPRRPGGVWTAADIETRWTRVVTPAGVTYRSPRLDADGPIDEVRVRRVAGRAPTRVLLLWGDAPTLSREDYLRNRRDESAAPRDEDREDVLRAADLVRDDSHPVRYLFLHAARAVALGTAIQSVAVATLGEIAAAPIAQARTEAAGDVRSAVLTRGAASFSYAVALPPGTEILFGVHVEASQPGTQVGIQMTVTSPGQAPVSALRTVAAGAWRELRLPAGVSGQTVVSFRASVRSNDLVEWSTPIVMAPDDRPDRPNVIVYVVDALRADRLGVYGNTPSPSPAIDRVARQGVVFEHAYTQATWTKPSVTSILTSLAPDTHRVGAEYFTDQLPDAAWTLQDALAGAGYLTAMFSANPLAGTLSNLDQGFDTVRMVDAFGAGAGVKVSAGDMNRTIQPWLEAHRDDRVLLYVHSLDVHTPYPPAGPGRFAAYDAAIARNDRAIGDLWRTIETLGLRARTLLVITADHGEAFGDHGQTGHGQSVYEEEARVPLIVVWPGHWPAAAPRDPRTVRLIDLMPTLLDAAGVPAEGAPLQGRSLLRRDQDADPPPAIVSRFVYPDDLDAATSDRAEATAAVLYPWKLIETGRAGAPPALALFNLAADPHETHDLSSADPERLTMLRRELDAYRAEQQRTRAAFVAATGEPATGLAPNRLPSRDVLDALRSLGYIK